MCKQSAKTLQSARITGSPVQSWDSWHKRCHTEGILSAEVGYNLHCSLYICVWICVCACLLRLLIRVIQQKLCKEWAVVICLFWTHPYSYTLGSSGSCEQELFRGNKLSEPGPWKIWYMGHMWPLRLSWTAFVNITVLLWLLMHVWCLWEIAL